jgi:hypothetical protein
MNTKHMLVALGILGGLLASGYADEPRVVHENIEWLDVWLPNMNSNDLPRVLLIGDSITRAYYKEVEEKLKGNAYVARLTTSKSIGDRGLLLEIMLVLYQTQFDVIHFNNGMHGWGYTEEEYRKAFPHVLEMLKKGKKGAKFIWASTTPVRESGNLDKLNPKTERVNERNRIALEFVSKEGTPVNDQRRPSDSLRCTKHAATSSCIGRNQSAGRPSWPKLNTETRLNVE